MEAVTAGRQQQLEEPPEVADVVGGIGAKVRGLRQQRGLSLQRLAERSGVSSAAIHKIERSGMVPTITTLMKLAAALNRPVSYFVDETERFRTAVHTPARARPPVYTSKQGLELGGIGGPYGDFFLAGAIATVEAGADSGAAAMQHPGEELVHVLDGTLEFEVDGETFAVAPGDSLHFQTQRPHRWRNPGGRRVRAVWLALRAR